MAALPEGDPAPSDGKLPNIGNLKNKPFSLYVHVPYCSKRCGYCDFNTYTPSELDRDDQIESWLQSAIKETIFARKILGEELTVDSIFTRCKRGQRISKQCFKAFHIKERFRDNP
jgi:oxygen-independent coproporphyrinogen-3 oxidase